MKRRTWIVVGGGLLLVGLVLAWGWFIAHPQRLAVKFVGYQAYGPTGREWAAVFYATNGTSTTVICESVADLPPDDHALEVPSPGWLEPHSDATWLCPVPDTNSVRHLEVHCYIDSSPLKQRLVDWVNQRWPNHPAFEVLDMPGHRYTVTCPTETY